MPQKKILTKLWSRPGTWIPAPRPALGCAITLAVFALISLHPEDKEIILFPGNTLNESRSLRVIGEWKNSGVAEVRKADGTRVFELESLEATIDNRTELLLDFESAAPQDATHKWKVSYPEISRRFVLDSSQAISGLASGRFIFPDKPIVLAPDATSIFAHAAMCQDLSIEFWLSPDAFVNNATVFTWNSALAFKNSLLPQRMEAKLIKGRIEWRLAHFFLPADIYGHSQTMSTAPTLPDITLESHELLKLKQWSKHLLRYSANNGMIEYYINGVLEDVTFATADGHEGSQVLFPLIGAASSLEVGKGFSGLLDDIRISLYSAENTGTRKFQPYPGTMVRPVLDFGSFTTRVFDITAHASIHSATKPELYFRMSNDIGYMLNTEAGWNRVDLAVHDEERNRGRYLQIKAMLLPDSTGESSPGLVSISVAYISVPRPVAPVITSIASSEGKITLAWKKVYHAFPTGYLIFYGTQPGNYYGTAANEGPSPIDTGDAQSFSLSGLINGQTVYMCIAAYPVSTDSHDILAKVRNAGDFSREVSARPIQEH